MNNLQLRIIVAAVGIPLVFGVIWLGGWWFACVVFLLSAVALHEYYTLASAKGVQPNVMLGMLFGLVIQVSVAIAFIQASVFTVFGFVNLTLLFVGIGALGTLAVELFRAKEHAFLNTAVTITGVVYVSLSMTSLIVLRNLHWHLVAGTISDYGAALLITLLCSIWACDSAAYFVGLAVGRHKLFPRVSPGKSWEGAVAGFVFCTLAFWLLSLALMPNLPMAIALGAGAIVGVVGQIGDLAESLLKRDAGVKDSSTLIPGHGGALDRFDSILFAGPVLLLYLYLFNW